MRISITGVPGTGKTWLAKALAEKLNFEVIHLTDMALDYKVAYIPELRTTDFDVDELKKDIEKILEDKDDVIVESHFSHFINPKYIDLLIVLNRDLSKLVREYKKRGYNETKIKDNLEAEAFNICYIEALEEGYPEEKIEVIENNSTKEELLERVLNLIKRYTPAGI